MLFRIDFQFKNLFQYVYPDTADIRRGLALVYIGRNMAPAHSPPRQHPSSPLQSWCKHYPAIYSLFHINPQGPDPLPNSAFHV